MDLFRGAVWWKEMVGSMQCDTSGAEVTSFLVRAAYHKGFDEPPPSGLGLRGLLNVVHKGM